MMLTPDRSYTNPAFEDGVLTPKEVAAYFDKSLRWVYRNASRLNGSKIDEVVKSPKSFYLFEKILKIVKIVLA